MTTELSQASNLYKPSVFQEEAPIQDSNDSSAEPSHFSPPHDDIVCAPLAADEYDSLLQSLRDACHSTNRLIVWGIKTQKDAGPAKKTPADSQNTMNTAVPHAENDFRLTPQSQYRKTWYGSKVNSGLVSRVREAIVLDCEMVMCGKRQEIGFLSAIDFVTGEVLINCHVQPRDKITRWNTQWSGITPQSMKAARREKNILWGWQQARHEVWRYSDQDTVFIGHDIRNDLNVLRIIHPKIVDTSILTNEAIFPDLSSKRKWSLKTLSRTFLGRSIQTSKHGHDALEDVQATRDVLLWCLRHNQQLQSWAKWTRASATAQVFHISHDQYLLLSTNQVKSEDVGLIEANSVTAPESQDNMKTFCEGPEESWGSTAEEEWFKTEPWMPEMKFHKTVWTCKTTEESWGSAIETGWSNTQSQPGAIESQKAFTGMYETAEESWGLTTKMEWSTAKPRAPAKRSGKTRKSRRSQKTSRKKITDSTTESWSSITEQSWSNTDSMEESRVNTTQTGSETW